MAARVSPRLGSMGWWMGIALAGSRALVACTVPATEPHGTDGGAGDEVTEDEDGDAADDAGGPSDENATSSNDGAVDSGPIDDADTDTDADSNTNSDSDSSDDAAPAEDASPSDGSILPPTDAGGAIGPFGCSKRFSAAGRQWTNSVAVDVDHRIAITGQYDGTVDFGGGPLPAVAANGAHGYLAVFDGACNHLFSQAFTEAGMHVAFTSNGNLLWNGTPTYNPHYPKVVLFDRTGGVVRSQTYPSSGSAHFTSIALGPDDALYVGGQFTADLDLGGGVLTGTPNGSRILVAKFDAEGHHVWSKGFGGPEGVPPQPTQHDVQIRGIGITSDGDAIVTGLYAASLDLGGGDLGVPSFPQYKGFLASFRGSNGAHVWSKAWLETIPGYASGLAVGPAGVFLGASIRSGTIDFGAGSITAPDSGTGQPVLTRFLNDGGAVWTVKTPAVAMGMSAPVGDVTLVARTKVETYAASNGTRISQLSVSTNSSWQSITIGPAGQLVVGGQTGTQSNEDVYLLQKA